MDGFSQVNSSNRADDGPNVLDSQRPRAAVVCSRWTPFFEALIDPGDRAMPTRAAIGQRQRLLVIGVEVVKLRAELVVHEGDVFVTL